MILALDYGTRYVGVAITDYDEKIALRHSVIDQKAKNLFDTIHTILATEAITKILVGVPVSLSGRISQQTKITDNFIATLRAAVSASITIEGVDETLTSVEAEQHIKIEGAAPHEAHAEAARIMLEDYLRTALQS